MIRHCACIITNDKVLLGNPNEQHRDIIINNNLQRDEDIIGYYDFHLPNLFIPNVNYYLYNEEKCEELIEKYLLDFINKMENKLIKEINNESNIQK